MLQRLRNIIRSWSQEDSQENQDIIILNELKQSLNNSNKAIEQLKTQLQQHELKIQTLETERLTLENEGKTHLKRSNKAQAEVSIAKMYRTEERLNHLRTIYTELSNSLGDLENNKERLEYKIQRYQNKKLVVKAKTIHANNELEVTKNLSALEEMDELEKMEEQLLEAQCLNEAFGNVELFENKSQPSIQEFEEGIKSLNAKKETEQLEHIAKMMGTDKRQENNNEKVRAKALQIQKEFEKNMNNLSKENLLEKWIKINNSKEKSHHDKIDDFFSSTDKDDLIKKFFN